MQISVEIEGGYGMDPKPKKKYVCLDAANAALAPRVDANDDRMLPLEAETVARERVLGEMGV
jgi:hypothetical protein